MIGDIKQALFLDDVRNPLENDWHIFIPIPVNEPYEITWVKSYQEFVDWVTENGLPDSISFDHDLGWDENDNDLPSGFDCAKWLVDYCIERDLKIPLYNMQSANPVGKANIDGLLQNYIKHFH